MDRSPGIFPSGRRRVRGLRRTAGSGFFNRNARRPASTNDAFAVAKRGLCLAVDGVLSQGFTPPRGRTRPPPRAPRSSCRQASLVTRHSSPATVLLINLRCHSTTLVSSIKQTLGAPSNRHKISRPSPRPHSSASLRSPSSAQIKWDTVPLNSAPNSMKTNSRCTKEVRHSCWRRASNSTRLLPFLSCSSLCILGVYPRLLPPCLRLLANMLRSHYNESIDGVRPRKRNLFKPGALRWAFVFMGSVFVRELTHG